MLQLHTVALIFVTACAGQPVRVLITATDGLQRNSVAETAVAELLAPPEEGHRTIGTLVAYQDAKHSDELLWAALRQRAALLGAHAVVQVERQVVPCLRILDSSEVVAMPIVNASNGASDEEDMGWDVLEEPPLPDGRVEIECVEIRADAIILGKPIDCRQVQTCRTHRRDAYVIEPGRDYLENR